MDCVISKREFKEVILELTERLTRTTKIIKMKRKTQEEVVKVLDKLERKYKSKFKEIFKSITMDNSCEFVYQKLIERSIYISLELLRIMHIRSWKRGNNENTNKIIRRFIPKESDIRKYKKKELRIGLIISKKNISVQIIA